MVAWMNARCGERAALLAIDLVAVITVQDQLPLEAARELKTVQEHIMRIVIAHSIAPVVITVARVVFRLTVGRRTASKLDPMHLDVSRVVIAITRVLEVYAEYEKATVAATA
jgi:hypothetical protein